MISNDNTIIWEGSRGGTWQMFFKRDFLKKFEKFTINHLNWSYFLIKLQVSRPLDLFFLKKNISGWLLRVVPVNCTEICQKVPRKTCKGLYAACNFLKTKWANECIWVKKVSRKSFDLILEKLILFSVVHRFC